MNTAETAQLLRVSGSTVNRALQLLAQRGLIRRRQRQGTLIAADEAQATLRRVHIVIREDHLRTEGLWADGVLFGLQGTLPGVDVQFNFRPQSEEAEYVERLIDDVLRTANRRIRFDSRQRRSVKACRRRRIARGRQRHSATIDHRNTERRT